jgi:hypothetical protein
MTHMDDQVAKHIKDMVRRIMREPSKSQEQPAKPDTRNQVVQVLRQGPAYPYELVRLTGSRGMTKAQDLTSSFCRRER